MRPRGFGIIFLIPLAGCQLPVREFRPGSAFVERDKVYVYSSDGGTAFEVTPNDLTWRELRRGVVAFDVDAEGPAYVFKDDPRVRGDDARCLFTRHALVICSERDGVRFFSKRDRGSSGPPREVDIRPIAVDYHRDRLWAWSAIRGLLSLGPGESEWTEARVTSDRGDPLFDDACDLPTLRFGRRRFAFASGSCLFFGDAEAGALHIRGTLEFESTIDGMHVNNRNSDIFVLVEGSRLWVWDVVGGRGFMILERLRYSPLLLWRPDARRFFLAGGGTVLELDDRGMLVRQTVVRLDGLVRVINVVLIIPQVPLAVLTMPFWLPNLKLNIGGFGWRP